MFSFSGAWVPAGTHAEPLYLSIIYSVLYFSNLESALFFLRISRGVAGRASVSRVAC